MPLYDYLCKLARQPGHKNVYDCIINSLHFNKNLLKNKNKTKIKNKIVNKYLITFSMASNDAVCLLSDV